MWGLPELIQRAVFRDMFYRSSADTVWINNEPPRQLLVPISSKSVKRFEDKQNLADIKLSLNICKLYDVDWIRLTRLCYAVLQR
jgi:hypothetical protein